MGGVLIMEIWFWILLGAAAIFFVGAGTFHIIETTRLRRARKNYNNMIKNAMRHPERKDKPQNPFRPLPRPAPKRDN